MSKNVASNSLNINKLKSDDFLAGLHTSYLSNIEASILRANFPIKTEEPEEFDVVGEKKLNRKEALNWKVEIPLSKYSLNEDKKPKIIKKKFENKLVYIQELVIRYLRPPTVDPSEIVIKQEPDYYLTSAPPLVIRQQPKQPKTPEPLVIREEPPKQPPLIGNFIQEFKIRINKIKLFYHKKLI